MAEVNWTNILADIKNILDDNFVGSVSEEDGGGDAFIQDYLEQKNMSEGLNTTLEDAYYFLENMGYHLDLEDKIW